MVMDKAMQDSRVEWIEKSPQHWKKDKIYRLADFISSGGTPSSTNEGFYGGDIMWVQTGDLNNDFIYKSSKQITLEGLKNSSAKIFPKNTLLIAMYGATIGKLGILTAEAATNQACCAIFVSKKMNIKFTFYLFMAMKDYLVFQSYGGGQPNISQEIIKQQYVYYPHFLEQQAIAEYLDQQCGKLDAIIGIKQQQIKTLDTLRQSVIYQAVTKGLDASAPLVDSGVEWLGKIPHGWKVKIIKREFNVKLGKMLQPLQQTESDTEEYYLKTSNIYWDGVDVSDVKKMWFSPLDKVNTELKHNDLLVCEGGDVGRSALWKEEITPCYIQNAINRVRPIYDCSTNYLYYWLFLLKHMGYIDAMVSRITIAHLTAEKLERLIFLLPPRSEQQRIADHLDQEIQRLNVLKANLNQQISTLEAYKKSLIYECVTGKKSIKTLAEQVFNAG